MRGSDGVAQCANRRLADFANIVNAALRTQWDFSGAVEFDVRRQVVGEVDAVAIPQMIGQSELVGCGINWCRRLMQAFAGLLPL